MSLLSQLHDLQLAVSQFRVHGISPEDEQRIAHLAGKLTMALDVATSRNPSAQQQQQQALENPDGETLLSIARQYGIRVADLRRHNAHLQHFEDMEPLPRNTPVKIKGRKGAGAALSAEGSMAQGVDNSRGDYSNTSTTFGQPQQRYAFDTIRSVAQEHNVTVDALVAANRVLTKFDPDEPLPQDLDIAIPAFAPPAQRTYVLTFAGETLRVVAESAARCRPEELLAVNPQLGNIGIDTRLPEGTRVALPR